MTRDEFIGLLGGYLDEYEGSTPMPEHVRDAIRADLPSTRQRRGLWPAVLAEVEGILASMRIDR